MLFFRSRNKNSLREHMRVRHIQVPEVCSICGKMSANKKALMKHKKFHFAEAREKFKCNVCGRGFRDSTKLKVNSQKQIILKPNRNEFLWIRNTRTYTVAFRTFTVAAIVRKVFVSLRQCTLIGKKPIRTKSSTVPTRSHRNIWIREVVIITNIRRKISESNFESAK